MPKLVMGLLEDAIHAASEAHRPLLIYIHDLENLEELSTEFFKETIANKEAETMLVIIT